MKSVFSFFVLSLSFLCASCVPSTPVYPVTAALFEDRFSLREWNDTIDLFKEIGGDTIWKHAPPMFRRSIQDLQNDTVFKNCVDNGKDCFSQAQKELTSKGLKILSFASYQNSEAYGEAVLKCPQYDKKIAISKDTYYRIVLPADKLSSAQCSNYKGENVVVLFASLSGPEPHGLLLESAFGRNVSVYFGIPRLPRQSDKAVDMQLMTAYYEWVQRVLLDHKSRYTVTRFQDFSTIGGRTPTTKKFLYDAVVGYYISDEVNLGNVKEEQSIISAYSTLSSAVKSLVKKKTAISPMVDLTKFGSNKTIEDHVQGLQVLAKTSVDVIAINEGRGYGKAPYYWPTQEDLPISQIDSSLDKILQRINPNWRVNGTFRDGFTGSVHELFRALGNETSFLNQNSSKFELWLGIDAFEDLNDDPCISSKNVEKTMNAVNKSRIDLALSHGGFAVHKVVAFSWDPNFTCRTKRLKNSLADAILNDYGRPMVVDCRFHSSFNRSVVILGVNLLALQQSFKIDWPDRDGNRHTSSAYGYYFETDYGLDHGLIPTIIYTQTYDPYNVIDLADKGYVAVQAGGAYTSCIFEFDFTRETKR
ncbi:uncharacterized protein LOC134263434 [Saccostrea cucullata]|uniref:uncharacterized protein LOC134263434 n=1 Tax=Saccostrea cuccullata TaxID=36930 RepID=UPI002ED4ED4A